MPQAPATVPDDDLTLIAQALDNNTDAFNALIRRHQPIVMNMALRVLKNTEEAEDIVQQVFIDAFRHLKEFRQAARFSTWLCSITLNRCRNRLRARKRHQESSLDAPMEIDGDAACVTQIPDMEKNPLDRLETHWELAWVRKQVERLSPEYREIFELFYYADLSLQAIAQKLGRPLNTVKVYLHRARKELYELCEEAKPT